MLLIPPGNSGVSAGDEIILEATAHRGACRAGRRRLLAKIIAIGAAAVTNCDPAAWLGCHSRLLTVAAMSHWRGRPGLAHRGSPAIGSVAIAAAHRGIRGESGVVSAAAHCVERVVGLVTIAAAHRGILGNCRRKRGVVSAAAHGGEVRRRWRSCSRVRRQPPWQVVFSGSMAWETVVFVPPPPLWRSSSPRLGCSTPPPTVEDAHCRVVVVVFLLFWKRIRSQPLSCATPPPTVA